MSHVQIEMVKGEDGKLVAKIGVQIQLTGTFQGGIYEQLSHRKVAKKFIEGVKDVLDKQIKPQLIDKLREEHTYYLHPERKPPVPNFAEVQNDGNETTDDELGHSAEAAGQEHADNSPVDDGGEPDRDGTGSEGPTPGVPFIADVPLIDGLRHDTPEPGK
jgi:hypothetical protein